MKVQTILDQIELGSMALPEFQRGYVWNRDQVRGLMQSMYHGYPVGSLLIWVTKTETAETRGDSELTPGTVKLLLDGQQRITSLYGIIRGKPPEFFEGNEKAFTDLYFNLDTEQFEFYMPMKMKNNPLWVSVTEMMQVGVGEFIQRIMEKPDLGSDMKTYINRLNKIENIKNIDFHIEEVTGEDKSIDIVVDIFNRVNSGGTKLSKGDLALAKICAAWPEARQQMRARLSKWRKVGFHFQMDWLLRCITAVVTREAYFKELDKVEPIEFKAGLERAEKHIDSLLNLISSRLGLDHHRVLGSRYAMPLMVSYLDRRKGQFADHKERDRLLYWYVHSLLWGRYSASTESILAKDLQLIKDKDRAIDLLIEELRRDRGDLSINPRDFSGWSRGSRFYPLMYMLTRVYGALDWESSVELKGHLLGTLSGLQLHHIFPKSLLYEHGYARPQVNALANFTFLTQETNLKVSNRNPAEYLKEYCERNPGVIESHWIPMDSELWKIENYAQFLDKRMELLASAANEFLSGLFQGTAPEYEAKFVPGGIATADEERLLLEVNDWVMQFGLPSGDHACELVDEQSGELLALLDLAWPKGLQEELSDPVALLLDEGEDTISAASRAGFRCFTNIEAFKHYVKSQILAEAV